MNNTSGNIITDNFLRQIERRIGLTYIETAPEGNVCFANNNDEMRDDFKQVFTKQDLGNYIKAVKDESGNIPLPENEKEFWNFVNEGRSLK